jgi:hypothetical protein
MLQTKEAVSRAELDKYIEEAASMVGYGDGFGIRGCDLAKPIWWAVYTRQSLEEQALNNRLPDYLRTSAQEAKKLSAIVPYEYIFYDAVTGEHLQRPNMIHLRKLVAERRITGVIFPALDRLSREPIHIGIFEFEAQYVGAQLHYADAPNGSDPMSQMVRMNIASAAKFVKLANRKNAVGGNIGRVVKGSVPAHRASYGYRYRREVEVTPDGRVYIKRAWWEIDELGPDGRPLWESPAWVVVQIFSWVGEEGRTFHWVANQLNVRGIKTAEGRKWSPNTVAKIVHRECYSGRHTYNVNARVPNPNRPLGDITAEVKRTLLRPKPQQEWVTFQIPPLVSEDLCQKATRNAIQRGRGRGKQGKSIQSLLRNRILCPRCGRPMVVRRNGRLNRVYYHCSRYFQAWAEQPCNYKRFIPGTWDDLVWEDICAWLRNDAWVEQQLTSEQYQDENVEKLIRLQQLRISQARAKIAKVQEGFEGSIYSIDDARVRIADLQETIGKAEVEIQRLQKTARTTRSNMADINATRAELKALRDRNLDVTTFEERLDVVSRLGIKVYPSEDLKAMKVLCKVNLDRVDSDTKTVETELKEMQVGGETKSATECGKVMFDPP